MFGYYSLIRHVVLRAKYEVEKTHLTWRQKRGGQYFGYQLLNRNGVQVIEDLMAATGDPRAGLPLFDF